MGGWCNGRLELLLLIDGIYGEMHAEEEKKGTEGLSLLNW